MGSTMLYSDRLTDGCLWLLYSVTGKMIMPELRQSRLCNRSETLILMAIHGAKKPDVLLLSVNYPAIDSEKDGACGYIVNAAKALIEVTGWHVRVIALRFGGQKTYEENDRISIHRLELPGKKNYRYDSDGAVDVPTFTHDFESAVSTLARGASESAAATGHRVPVLCHNCETANAAAGLGNSGYPVVYVVHYLSAHELMFRFEAAEDPLRDSVAGLTLSSTAGMFCPRKYRPALVRTLTLGASVLSNIPLPRSLELLYRLRKEALLMNKAHLIVAMSPSSASSIAEFYPAARNKLRVAAAGPPAPASRSYWPFPGGSGRLRLVMVSRPVPWKGWHYVAEALKNLEKTSPELAGKLEFAAIGGLEEFGGAYGRRNSLELDGLRKVSFANLGDLPHPEVMEVMSAADALVLPSVFETFGLVTLEAMANGCMVLASDADGPRDVVKAPWGIIMDFQDPKKRVSEIERGILKLLSLSRDEMSTLGGEARAASLQYSWKKCAEAHAAILEEARLLAAGGG